MLRWRCTFGSTKLNQRLKEAILRRRKIDPGVVCHNAGGWHSDRDLLKWPDQCIRELLEQLSEYGKLYYAWANVNEAGQYNRSHHHGSPAFSRSGVYVVEGDTGALVFEPDEIVIMPRPGALVLFPATQWHRVEPCDSRRITIAFNFAA